jgi:ABC-2 type transport system ATP-binding protein
MIVADNITMKFYAPDKAPFVALDALSCKIPKGCIYGMIGSNGAGKSTFLRLLSGVYRPDAGSITVDGMPVWENPAAKERIVYIPDELRLAGIDEQEILEAVRKSVPAQEKEVE